jgi:hypothetical protein
VSEAPKVCAADGCKNILPAYRRKDLLGHEHGAQLAKAGRTRRTADPGAVEQFQEALLEETLASLVRDPSRWRSDDAGTYGNMSLRSRSRVVHNQCPGWMCGALFDGPLPPGTYCSAACKKQTIYIRGTFRRDLDRLRSAATPTCIECGRKILGRTDAKACSTRCYQRRYQREKQRRVHGWKPRHQEPVA